MKLLRIALMMSLANLLMIGSFSKVNADDLDYSLQKKPIKDPHNLNGSGKADLVS